MADIPPPPPPPSSAPPPPPYQGLPPSSPGYMPAGIGPTMGSGLNLGAQFAGARSSIILGAVGIVVPVATAIIFSGTLFYFYVVPIFGLIYGIRAMTRGFALGGIIGVVLNVLAGLISLTFSGILNRG